MVVEIAYLVARSNISTTSAKKKGTGSWEEEEALNVPHSHTRCAEVKRAFLSLSLYFDGISKIT